MNVENLVGMNTTTKVYDDGNLSIFLAYDKAGDIWFHHDIKQLTKDVYDNRINILEEVFHLVKATTQKEAMYSWCPTETILKWAENCGWKKVGEAEVNNEHVYIVEYS